MKATLRFVILVVMFSFSSFSQEPNRPVATLDKKPETDAIHERILADKTLFSEQFVSELKSELIDAQAYVARTAARKKQSDGTVEVSVSETMLALLSVRKMLTKKQRLSIEDVISRYGEPECISERLIPDLGYKTFKDYDYGNLSLGIPVQPPGNEKRSFVEFVSLRGGKVFPQTYEALPPKHFFSKFDIPLGGKKCLNKMP